MASEPSSNPGVSEPPTKPELATDKPSSSDVLQKEDDDKSHPEATEDMRSASEAKIPVDSKPAQEPEPAKDSESAEQPQPSEQPSASANGVSNEAAPEIKPDQRNLGDKREHEATSSPAHMDKASVGNLAGPRAKKQKMSEDHTVTANATSASDGTEMPNKLSNGEKKRGGRTKKTREATDIPTDGIGSRTRSRTKVVP